MLRWISAYKKCLRWSSIDKKKISFGYGFQKRGKVEVAQISSFSKWYVKILIILKNLSQYSLSESVSPVKSMYASCHILMRFILVHYHCFSSFKMPVLKASYTIKRQRKNIDLILSFIIWLQIIEYSSKYFGN